MRGWSYLYNTPRFSLVPGPKDKRPENFYEFKLYMNVSSWQLQYWISAYDTYNFVAVRTGISCLWKQLFAVGSTIEHLH